jgi:hypothetical protein
MLQAERFHLHPTRETPEIIFDPANRLVEISGNSFPNNVEEFYLPIIHMVEDYLRNHPSLVDMEIIVRLNYINTSSAKLILEFIRVFELWIHSDQHHCYLRWFYFEDDPEMRSLAEDITSNVTFEYQIIANRTR